MATIEDLKKEVERLEQLLKDESEKTRAVEQQVKTLTDEVSALKGSLAEGPEDFTIKEDEKSAETKKVILPKQASMFQLVPPETGTICALLPNIRPCD